MSALRLAIADGYKYNSNKQIIDDNDVEIVKLKKGIKYFNNFATVYNLDKDELEDKQATIAGYSGSNEMRSMEGLITTAQNNRLFYDIDTKSGQSGSGICFYGEEDSLKIVGVHTDGADRAGYYEKETDVFKYNSGVRINKKKNKLITKLVEYSNT